MSMSEYMQYSQKTVVGNFDTSDSWEVYQYWISDYKERVEELEPPQYISSNTWWLRRHAHPELVIYKEDGAVLAKFKGSPMLGEPDIFRIVDQNDSPLLESRDHPYTLDHSQIIDPSKNILRDGALVVEIYIKVLQGAREIPPFVPRNQSSENILNLLADEESADISFKIEGVCNFKFFDDDDDLNNCLNIQALFGVEAENEDKPMHSNVIIYAHIAILKASAPLLASLCKGYDKDHPVPVSGIEPGVFRHLLRYLYGGRIPATDLNRRPLIFLDAADRFGIVDLKIEAEACFVKSDIVASENLVDIYQYAVSKNCALLKEAAQDFFVEHGKEVLKSSAREEIFRSPELAVELLELTFASRCPVDVLRRELYVRGLSIDGTYGMLLARLARCLRNEKRDLMHVLGGSDDSDTNDD